MDSPTYIEAQLRPISSNINSVTYTTGWQHCTQHSKGQKKNKNKRETNKKNWSGPKMPINFYFLLKSSSVQFINDLIFTLNKPLKFQWNTRKRRCKAQEWYNCKMKLINVHHQNRPHSEVLAITMLSLPLTFHFMYNFSLNLSKTISGHY